jgi:hypothetical protein
MGKLGLTVFGAAVVLLAACGDDDAAPKKDGGADGGIGLRDGGGDGGGVRGDGGPAHFGSACKRDGDCGAKLSCDTEVDVSFTASNLPAGERQVRSFVFPGGVCTPIPAAAFTGMGDSCDPTVPRAAQGCGSDGVCVGVSVDQQQQLAACRPHCDPTAPKNQCGRFGYTCDFDLEACVEGCQSDDECRLQVLDTNSDGTPDKLQYDDMSMAQCDPDSFRCVHHGSAGGKTGDPCVRLDDCAQEGLCIQSLQSFASLPFPGGYCTQLACDVKGRECQGDNAVCTRLRSWSPGLITPAACFTGCNVGAEPKADQLGVTGHGDGCRDGYRCHWTSGLRAGQGVCVGGNYNAVTKNNIGASCTSNKDCYSPFGLGRCMSLSVGGLNSPGGMCTVMDCGVPGLPDDLCGPSAQCIGLSGDVTFCVEQCKDATQCAKGYGCTDDDNDPSTSKICYPACHSDADCRKGSETCNAAPTTPGSGAAGSGSSSGSSAPPVGQCVASKP